MMVTVSRDSTGLSIEGIRTFLYVPGDRPERFPKAVASGAGAVVLDLEDAVAVDAKERARAHVASFLAHAERGHVQIWIRVNSGPGTLSDLEAMASCPPPDGLVVAKATVEVVTWLAAHAPSLPLVALVESAHALLELRALAAAQNVVALALGEVDLSAELGLAPDLDDASLAPIRLQLVVASTAQGLAPPIGPVCTRVSDFDRLSASTATLARLGYGSRQAIHPGQVKVIDAGFRPNPDEIAAAREVLTQAAAARHGAAVDENGRLLDAAVVRAARRCLFRAGLATDEGGSM